MYGNCLFPSTRNICIEGNCNFGLLLCLKCYMNFQIKKLIENQMNFTRHDTIFRVQHKIQNSTRNHIFGKLFLFVINYKVGNVIFAHCCATREVILLYICRQLGRPRVLYCNTNNIVCSKKDFLKSAENMQSLVQTLCSL